MTARVQENRTTVPNTPPANNSLQVGELYVELASPQRLWAGVPTTVTASGVQLLLDVAAQASANAGAVQRAGDSMTGPLVLPGPPTAPAQAASKAYVDSTAPGLAPVQSVAAKIGAVTLIHTDITDWTASLTTALAPYAPLASPVLTGNPQAPTPSLGDADQSIATTAFVAAGFAPIVSPTFTGNPQAPTAPPGDNDQSLATTAFVHTAIGTGFAPLASPVFTGDPQAPTASPGDADQSLATTAFVSAAVAPALHDVGRNLLHNPLFNVAQRGAGPFAVGGYTLDRWFSTVSLDTVSIRQAAMGDSNRSLIGDEEAIWALQNTFTGNAGAGAYNFMVQRIEKVNRLAGKTVTVSFWANSPTAPKLGVNLTQLFGTGGSPSAQNRILATGNAFTIAAGAWTRFTSTITVPSVIGKTLGTNGDDYTQIEIWYSSGANTNAVAGNIGVQSGTINIWGVQLEIGSVMTPLEKPDPQQDLAKCQRFYATGHAILQAYGTAGMPVNTAGALPVSMRTFPTITLANNYSFNIGAITWAALGVTCGASSAATVTAAGMFAISATFLASADL